MDELLTGRLEILAQDEIAVKALKALIENRIELSKPSIEPTDNDKVLGEKYRAYEQAKNLLNGVIQDIETYNIKKNKTEILNRAK
jgi:hypothetical protein